MGCPKSPMWESGDEAWSEDESAPSNLMVLQKATWATVRCASSDCMGLVTRSLGAGEGGIELPRGPGNAVPGNARGPLSQQGKPFS